MDHLIYVSNNVLLPNSQYNPFFLQEREFLQHKYGEFSVICLNGIYLCAKNGELVQQYSVGMSDRALGFLLGICDSQLYKELLRMAKDRKTCPRNIAKMIRFSRNAAILHRLLEKTYEKRCNEELTVYSFWMDYDAYAVAKLKRKHKDIRAIARAHAYEIQPNRTVCAPYMMKREICTHIDKIAFISKDALNTFLTYHPRSENLTVVYLGSKCGDARAVDRLEDDVLTIATCSAIIPLKQLEWMVHVCANWHYGKLKWIHMGDGPDRRKRQS